MDKIMRLIGLAVIEGNLQTHKYRFGIQPNNYKDRVREIEWGKTNINKLYIYISTLLFTKMQSLRLHKITSA